MVVVLAVAALLRLLWIADGWFGVDQARDIAWAQAIAAGERFPLAGPLMRGRIHLGALYYYVWSIPALVSDATVAAYVFAAVLGVAAVWMTDRLGRRLAGPWVGHAAGMLLATMPVAVIDSRVAWAPAALPPLAAAFLLAATRFVEHPSRRGAVLVATLAALGTQLHLAAAPLAPIAALVLLGRRRAVGWRSLVLAAAAALVPLLPMAYAYRLDSQASLEMRGDTLRLGTSGVAAEAPSALASRTERTDASPPPGRDVRAGRLRDVLTVHGRVLDALSAPAGERPHLANLWIAVERAWMPVMLLAALICLGRVATARGSPVRAPVALVAGTLLVGVLVVAALPAEAWSYYLDATLVPAAVVVALVLRPDRARLAAFAVVVLACVRTAGLVWWIASAHGNGFVRANLEPLRLGGEDAAASVGRARLLTLRIKEAAADVLVRDLALPLADLRQRAHGVGFADLDTDNGYFFRRAALRLSRAEGDATGSSHDALVVYAASLPEHWTRGDAAPRVVGPLAIHRYVPRLRVAEARIETCGDATVPGRLVSDPRDYFFGQPQYPTWPCRDAVVRIPSEPPPDGGSVRVFARGLGAMRIVSVGSEPTGTEVDAAPLGAGVGLVLPAEPAVVRIALTIDGPAALDVYEIHGAPEDASGRR